MAMVHFEAILHHLSERWHCETLVAMLEPEAAADFASGDCHNLKKSGYFEEKAPGGDHFALEAATEVLGIE